MTRKGKNGESIKRLRVSWQNLERFLITWFDLVCAVIALYYKRARVSACKRSRSLATSKLNRNEFHHRRRTGSMFELDISSTYPFSRRSYTSFTKCRNIPDGFFAATLHSLFIHKSRPHSPHSYHREDKKIFREKIRRLSR